MEHLNLKESLTVEFKSDRNCLPDNDIIDAVVALANTEGGELYLGVEDDGEITGLHQSHLDITRLSAFIANKTIPPISVRAEISEYEHPVLKISVPSINAIVSSSSGKISRRRIKADGTPENVPMYPYEISSRLSSLSLLDYSAQPVPDADYHDLDNVERERLRNLIRAYRGDASLLELSDEELDIALRFAVRQNNKPVPTFCGLLMIGRKEAIHRHMPTAEAAIQILVGTDIKVNESFCLPILAAFDKIMEYFSAWNRSEEMEDGLFRITIPEFDPRAFREALVNAFCHRDYSILGRVRIQINDEGMTVSNPGGFIEGIDIHRLIDAEPHGRNPALADAMKRVGLAERTGRGIDRIYEGSLLHGRLLPDYSESTSSMVKLFIPRGPIDRAFIQMVSSEQQRLGRSLPILSLLILNELKYRSKSSILELASALHLAENRVRVAMEALVSSGPVEAGGNGRGRYYLLSPKYYQKAKNESAYIRQKGIDPIRFHELVMQLADSKEYIDRADVVELLHVTPPQAYRILARLSSEGKLQLVGRGAGAKYKKK